MPCCSCGSYRPMLCHAAAAAAAPGALFNQWISVMPSECSFETMTFHDYRALQISLCMPPIPPVHFRCQLSLLLLLPVQRPRMQGLEPVIGANSRGRRTA